MNLEFKDQKKLFEYILILICCGVKVASDSWESIILDYLNSSYIQTL